MALRDYFYFLFVIITFYLIDVSLVVIGFQQERFGWELLGTRYILDVGSIKLENGQDIGGITGYFMCAVVWGQTI